MAVFCTGDRGYNNERGQGQHLNRFTMFLTKRYLRTIEAEYSGVSKVSLPNDLEVEVVIYPTSLQRIASPVESEVTK